MTEYQPKYKNIYHALSAFQAVMPTVKKTVENNFRKSKYADLAAIYNAAQPHIAACEMAVTHSVNLQPEGSVLSTHAMHWPSQTHVSTQSAIPAGLTPQEYGSYITYLRRYNGSSILNIVAEGEDDDGNAANQAKPAPKPVAAKAPAVAKHPLESFATMLQACGDNIKLFSPVKAKYITDWQERVKQQSDKATLLQNEFKALERLHAELQETLSLQTGQVQLNDEIPNFDGEE